MYIRNKIITYDVILSTTLINKLNNLSCLLYNKYILLHFRMRKQFGT